MGHGHVTPNTNGTRANCGGPAICTICAREEAEKTRADLGMKRITLTLKRRGLPDSLKELAFGVGETVHEVIEAARDYWRLPAGTDLRLIKANGGFALEPWLKMGELSARPEVELILVAR